MAAWRLARALERLRSQIDARFPNRSKRSDGTIGDASHRRRGSQSDHNPHVRDGRLGVVTALDITHSPAHQLDTWLMAEWLRQKRDPRIKYVISNRRIFSSTSSPWKWRRYTGSNPHSGHIHISTRSTKTHYDDTRDWDLGWRPLPSASAEPAEDPDSPALRPVLRRGAKGDYVKTVQRLLLLQVTGDFGPLTEAAVRAFQRTEELTPDGIVGPRTWAKLDLIEQLPLPMEFDEPRLLSEPE